MPSWTGPIVAVVFVWLLTGAACLPVLAAASVRDAIGEWPTDRYVLNYVILMAAVVVGQTAVFLGAVVVRGGIGGRSLFRWTFLVAVGYPAVVWVILAVVLPAIGRFDPSSDGLDGRIVLALAAIWYAVVVAVAAAITFFLLFVFYFPG
ncbi:hypothetical protein ACFQAS_03415 [Halopenitus salinus]|uniref:Yip1 domain-containing protein n=1 Tax=Halopenitus salinus TaxID=1198295 RepID=A0ABD5UQC8_9EURY